jgi:hypothetical protein
VELEQHAGEAREDAAQVVASRGAHHVAAEQPHARAERELELRSLGKQRTHRSELGDRRRQIGVEIAHELRRLVKRRQHALPHGFRLAHVAIETEHAKLRRVALSELIQERARAVRGAVVHQQERERRVGERGRREAGRIEALRLVVARDD